MTIDTFNQVSSPAAGDNLPSFNAEKNDNDYKSASPARLEALGFKDALEIFHFAAKHVPAYADFLKKRNVKASEIQTLDDFKRVPIVDKENYLKVYSLNELCIDGKLENMFILSSSSGSTGEPFLWPRGELQEREGTLTFELIFSQFFELNKYSTLYINCFSMGTWISGPFVLSCAENLTRKGYKILTVTPGIEKEITLTLFKKLAPYFQQIVFSGYPPLVKDVIDSGKKEGIDWKKYRIRFLFAAEGFSEYWREYLHNEVGSKEHFTTSINLFGSADAAILAHETPITTLIRKMVTKDPSLGHKIFNDSRLPTLAQYDPRLKYFESVDGNLIFTTLSGIPLIRYSIGDSGGVYSYEEMNDKLAENNVNLDKEVKKNKLDKYQWRLPYVYVFGRKNLTVSFYGLLIYPEHFKYCLENAYCQKYTTGKFVMTIQHDKKQDPYLVVYIELHKDKKVNSTIKQRIEKIILRRLIHINSEYGALYKALRKRAIPILHFMPQGHEEYFRPGAKQRWVKK